jgi:protein dispatched 1
VAIAAMDMGLKNALFDEYLLLDGWLVGLGGIFITLCMWMYTTSLFVTIMSIVAVLFSLGVTYFIYTIVFGFSFFPFMNLLAIIVVVGKFVFSRVGPFFFKLPRTKFPKV